MKKRMIPLALVLCLLISGCRPSATFTQILYDDFQEETAEEPEIEEIDDQEDYTDQDDQLPSKTEDEAAETLRGREREDASPGEDTPEEELAPDTQWQGSGSPALSAEAPEPAGDAGDAERGTGAAPGETEPEAPPDTEDASNGAEGPGDTEIPAAGGNETAREIVDAYGNVAAVPENVSALSAAGEAALIVAMLGGGDRLRAASESFVQGLSGTIFGADWDGGVLWSGEGDRPLDGEAFEALLSSGVEACLAVSGRETFSEEQAAALRERGIAYVVLPPLNNSENILRAVSLAGEILGGDAERRAAEYAAWYRNMLARLSAAAGPFRPDGIDYGTGNDGAAAGDGVYALYLGAWDPSVRYSLYSGSAELLSGTGMAAAMTSYLDSPVTELLSLSGVANTAALKRNSYLQPWLKLKITPNDMESGQHA